MSKTVLIATDKPFSSDARERAVSMLEEAGYTARVLEAYGSKTNLIQAVGDVHALVVRSDEVDAEVLKAAKDLRVVVRAGAGYDNVDCVTAKSQDVAVMNTPGQNANAVAELAVGMMVHMARGQFSGQSGSELRGKTLGLHAYGAVARAVHAIVKGFGMNVLAHDPLLQPVDVERAGAAYIADVKELYRQSHYVSLHFPSNDETRRSIGKALLSLMPTGGTLVNTARAEIIHEQELLEVLAERSDFHYATDVAPANEVKAVIADKYADRVFMTPKKMGAQTREANYNAGVAAARQIIGFFERGDRTFVVNR